MNRQMDDFLFNNLTLINDTATICKTWSDHKFDGDDVCIMCGYDDSGLS